MRLVLAHPHDAASQALAAGWGADALLLTPGELHEERLLLTVGVRGEARAALPSRPEVVSILCRLGGVGPADLGHVAAQDVEYAAAELHAFLRAWLAAWPGPVLNRPSATCLNGPGWSPEQWVLAATRTGLPVRTVRRLASDDHVVQAPTLRLPDPGDNVRVSIVGNRWIGAVSDDNGRRLCALARAAGCVLMEAVLDADGTLVHVGAWPDVSHPKVAHALTPLLDGAL